MGHFFFFSSTNVETKFNGDRYGEAKLKQTKEMDYYGQWDTNCPEMIFDLIKT